MSTHEKMLTVNPDGSVITLYDDNLPDLGKRRAQGAEDAHVRGSGAQAVGGPEDAGARR